MGTCLSSDRRRGWEYSPSSSPSGSQLLKKGSSKKFGSRGSSSSFDSKRHGPAQSIPGKMFVNGASQIASLFTQQGKKGTNQDAMVVWENFVPRTDAVFCGVFDGHGPLGHMVAKKVRDSLPVKLRAHWDMIIHNNDSRENTFNMTRNMNSEETASTCLHGEPVASNESVENEKNPEIFNILKESFLKAFKVMDKELRVHHKIDCSCSGTTAVTLVKQGQDLVIGNIGDSRAVLGTRDENNCLNAIQLTVDLKPNLPREAERIRRCKGRVFALRDEPDVARVWLPNNDSPGLAMARAFGDFCLKEFGLISVPEISYRRLTERDEFIVLATDGIWDVLSNTEVVDVVASSPTRSSAAQSLVELAVQTWRYKYPTSKVDDCAVVCLFLNEDTPNSIASHTENQNNTETLDTPETSHGNNEISNENALSDTIRASCDALLESKKIPRQLVGSQSYKRPSNGNAGALEMDERSALEGVSRVNTLITLPRFVVGGDRQPSDTAKIKK